MSFVSFAPFRRKCGRTEERAGLSATPRRTLERLQRRGTLSGAACHISLEHRGGHCPGSGGARGGRGMGESGGGGGGPGEFPGERANSAKTNRPVFTQTKYASKPRTRQLVFAARPRAVARSNRKRKRAESSASGAQKKFAGSCRGRRFAGYHTPPVREERRPPPSPGKSAPSPILSLPYPSSVCIHSVIVYLVRAGAQQISPA